MEKDLIISIIVPVYNVEKYLDRCVQSIVNQTYKNLEIILVDDGATDNSGRICDEWAKKDDRVVVIHKSNGGYGSVLEYAIAKIQTKYFMVCDSDDWLEENAVEKLYECAENNQVDLVIGERYFVYSDKKDKEINQGSLSLYPIESDKVYSNLEAFVFMAVMPQSKLYKTSFAKKIKFPHHVSYTDTILYLIYLMNIKNVIYINVPLTNYFADRPDSTNFEFKNMFQKGLKSIITVLNSIYEQSDKKSYLYPAVCYKLYRLILFMLIPTIPKDIEKDELKKIKKEIIDFLSKLKPEKRKMKKYIKSKNFIKTFMQRVIFDLLFCNLTNDFALNCIINFFNK